MYWVPPPPPLGQRRMVARFLSKQSVHFSNQVSITKDGYVQLLMRLEMYLMGKIPRWKYLLLRIRVFEINDPLVIFDQKLFCCVLW